MYLRKVNWDQNYCRVVSARLTGETLPKLSLHNIAEGEESFHNLGNYSTSCVSQVIKFRPNESDFTAADLKLRLVTNVTQNFVHWYNYTEKTHS